MFPLLSDLFFLPPWGLVTNNSVEAMNPEVQEASPLASGLDDTSYQAFTSLKPQSFDQKSGKKGQIATPVSITIVPFTPHMQNSWLPNLGEVFKNQPLPSS